MFRQVTVEIQDAQQNIVPCEETAGKETSTYVDELPAETSDVCEYIERDSHKHRTKKKQRKQHNQKYVIACHFC